ncbi:hypothetical protein RRG08_059345 [Elysia crispata]|uniref:Uncharacterized protein n=1 Tax=Elysia crispata TaxID=231223 RepID=A0AAE1EF52_9GAST|nr:hypothetical protein RRG08_059345 [Elysia crispata]
MDVPSREASYGFLSDPLWCPEDFPGHASPVMTSGRRAEVDASKVILVGDEISVSGKNPAQSAAHPLKAITSHTYLPTKPIPAIILL